MFKIGDVVYLKQDLLAQREYGKPKGLIICAIRTTKYDNKNYTEYGIRMYPSQVSGTVNNIPTTGFYTEIELTDKPEMPSQESN